jgi:hypothetical protein
MNVSLQTKNKTVLMAPGTPMPTKTNVKLYDNTGAMVGNNTILLGGKVNYPNGQAGTYTAVSQNQTDDGTNVGGTANTTVTFTDPVSVPVANGVDVVNELT